MPHLHLELSQTEQVALSREQVWDFLSKIDNVAACAPGYQSITQVAAAEWSANVSILNVIKLPITITRPLHDSAHQHMQVVAHGEIGKDKRKNIVNMFAEIQLYPQDPLDALHTAVEWKAIIDMDGTVALAGQSRVEKDIQRFFQKLLTSMTGLKSSQGSTNLLAWLWPWYLIACIAALMTATLVVTATGTDKQIAAVSLLTFTILAVGIMLLERLPELLLAAVGLAVWTTCWGFANPDPIRAVSILALLCVPIFASQFLWQGQRSVQHPFPEQSLPRVLSMGGIIILLPISIFFSFTSNQSGIPNLPAQVVTLVLLLFVLLLIWLTHMQSHAVARSLCDHAVPTLLSLSVPWELHALFGLSSPDLLTLVPAITLALTVPAIVRNPVLKSTSFGSHRFALSIMLCAATILLLPAFLVSFSAPQSQFQAMLILLIGSLGLYGFGLLTRIQYFPLTAWSIAILATIRAIFFVIDSPNPLQAQFILIIVGITAIILLTGVFRQLASKRSGYNMLP